jgi:hypothetical protein
MDSSRALSRACTTAKVALATAALVLGISGVAMAGSTQRIGATVQFNGDPGELNSAVTGYDTGSTGGPYVVVQEQNRTISNHAGSGCTNTNPNNSVFDDSTVWCGAGGGVTTVQLNGNDQNDFLANGFLGYSSGPGSASAFFPKTIAFSFNGGDGNDTIFLPSSVDTNNAQPGGTASGGAGNDSLNIADGQTANGGDGDDTLNTSGPYGGEKAPFVGATENGDAGNDSLNGSGSPTPDHLNGGDGDDVLFPGQGPESLAGGSGTDTVNWNGNGNGVNVSLDNVANDGTPGQNANANADIENVIGSSGFSDVLTGAPGVSNFIDGMGGNDTFNVANNPADADVVVCGDGFVTINADALDSFDTVGPTGCRGRINKPPVSSGLTLKIRSTSTKLDSDGEVAVKVGCRGTGNCRGLLEVDKSGTVLGTAQFVVPNGQTKRVSFLPRPAYAKRLKSGKSVTATATVDATDGGGATGSASSKITIHGAKHHKK